MPITPGISRLPTFAFQSPIMPNICPIMKRTSFFGVSCRGLVDLHRTIQFQLFGISGWGIDLDYCDDEWFALEVNRDHSLIFETAPKYRILDSFVDYAAKSLQSCPTLCDPMDGSPPGYLIPGILQARTQEWVAISFSNASK